MDQKLHLALSGDLSGQDAIFCALIGLARAANGNPGQVTEDTLALVRQALCSHGGDAEELVARIRREKARIAPNCAGCASPCGRSADYGMEEFAEYDETERCIRRTILFLLQRRAKRDIADSLTLDALNTVGDAWNTEYLTTYAEKL